MDERVLEERLSVIEKRNARVEADKAWEVSMFRRLFITGTTYIVASAVLLSIGSDKPFLSSLIPTAGYVLSTLSLPAIKRWWIARRK